jgi:hypothetical protein
MEFISVGDMKRFFDKIRNRESLWSRRKNLAEVSKKFNIPLAHPNGEGMSIVDQVNLNIARSLNPNEAVRSGTGNPVADRMRRLTDPKFNVRKYTR